MIDKRILVPTRLRRPPATGWSWMDRLFVREHMAHLSREAGNLRIVEPLGDRALLGPLEALDGFGLLVEVAGVLDFRFHRL